MQKNIPLLLKVVFLYVCTAAVLVPMIALTKNTDTVVPHSIVVAPASEPESYTPLLYGKPKQLTIARLGITLPIEDGRYDTKTDTWSISRNNAHYALTSHLPNNKYGNTVIYGHNRMDVLGATKKLKPYDELVITAANGRKFRYVYMDEAAVNPTNTQVFTKNTKGSRLTLLTCSGAWNQERRLMVFEFTETD